MQLTEAILRTVEFTILLFLTQTTKRSCSRFTGRGRNGKNNTQTPEKATQLVLHGVRFVTEH